jgi:predicted NUDIX family NTP pyrophosphohydrolase
MVKQSAGLLMYRHPAALEVLLVHPGGPFWKKRDAGVWTIPKGLVEGDEDLFYTACREFTEETGLTPQPPFLELPEIRQSSKRVKAWAFAGDCDPNPGIQQYLHDGMAPEIGQPARVSGS